MRNNRAARMLLVFLSLSPMTLFALPGDDQQNIQVESDSLIHHKKTGVTTYIGNVIAQQGSRTLRGDKMDVHQNARGDIEKLIVYGKPAQHESLTEPKAEPFQAEAQTIVYDAQSHQLTLMDDAKITQAGDTFEAPHIEYDVNDEIIRSKRNEHERTTITLKPRSAKNGA